MFKSCHLHSAVTDHRALSSCLKEVLGILPLVLFCAAKTDEQVVIKESCDNHDLTVFQLLFRAV